MIKEELEALSSRGQLRKIPDIESKSDGKIIIEGREYINLASNDYLGISTKAELEREFLSSGFYQFSSASARLLSGSLPVYKELEDTAAEITGKERALIFNTGYQCNLGVISALNTRGNVVFSDKLNHASIIDGMQLSQGDFYRYKHLDYGNLEKLLKSKRNLYKNAIIVSESIFSMDGDIADIDALVRLKKEYNCTLMIDEAHAFCCFGDYLGGAFYGSEVDIVTATFGKAVGSFGAFCASSSEIITYLINKARPFIFSTSIPPVNIAWSRWLLREKSEYLKLQKRKLSKLSGEAHALLKENGIETVSVSHIIPVIIGGNEETLAVSERLRSEGYYIPAIRPPTVPDGTSRLRISLTSDCKIEDFERLINFL